MILFRTVSKSFQDIKVVRNVDLVIADGETVVICGPSGSGKSTLIRLMGGLEVPSTGKIRVNGRNPAIGIRHGIGFVFQQFNLFPHLDVLRNITLAPRKVLRLSKAEAERQAQALLEDVGLGDKAHAWPGDLSGGQQQRVAIARALALRPKIMLFDEPTSALDPEMTDEVLAVMRKLAHSGITMVVVTHEMGFAQKVADRALFLEKGTILEDGPAQRFFVNPAHERARQFLRLSPRPASAFF